MVVTKCVATMGFGAQSRWDWGCLLDVMQPFALDLIEHYSRLQDRFM